MKKYDINTRQGRARRQNNYAQFNPETLLWARILSKGV